MDNLNRNNLAYLVATKGMIKKDRVNYLNDKIEENKDGFYLYFGTYQQFEIGKNGHYVMEPILWKLVNVTSFKTDGFLLLITKYLIDCKHFGYRSNYETSFIREYLNIVFYDIAFTKREKGCKSQLELVGIWR